MGIMERMNGKAFSKEQLRINAMDFEYQNKSK